MAQNMELRVRYADLIVAKMNSTIATKDNLVFNTYYEGDPKAGAVQVPKRGVATARKYNTTTGIAPEKKSTEYETIVLDQDYGVNEVVDKYEAAAIPDNVLAERLDAAGEALAQQLDTDGVATLLGTSNTIDPGAAADPTTAYKKVVAARTFLSKKKVPASQRFLLVSSDFYAALLESSQFVQVNAGMIAGKVVEDGVVGRVAGFNVIECDKLDDKNCNFIAGHPRWCSRVKEWQALPYTEDAKGDFIGASQVKGRMVYGYKLLNKDAVVKYMTE